MDIWTAFPKNHMTSTIPAGKNPKEMMDTPYASMWMEGGILYCKFAHDLHVSLDVARACVELRIFFSKSKSYPLLIDMRGIKSTTRESRKYMATVGSTLVTAGALITGSRFNTTIANIFLTIDKPPVPTKLFTSEEKARQWLKDYL